jgi:DNA polymerase-3 subunit delta'
MSDGNFREAMLLLENSEEDLLVSIREWLNITVKNNVAAQIKWIEDISKKGREKQKQLLKYFVHLIEQSVRARYMNEKYTNAVPESELDFALKLNKICDIEAQESLIAELNKAIYHIERNAHSKMLFHALTIRFLHIIRDNSLILVS